MALFSVLGVPVIDASQAQLVAHLGELVAGETQSLVVGANAQVCNLAAGDADYAKLIAQIDFAYADGQSVVWAGRALGGDFPERCATTDVVHPLMETAAEQGWRIFFFGAAPGVAQSAAQALERKHPRLQIRTHHGYVQSAAEHAQLVQEITDFAPQLLFVGLGEPAQQQWVSRHRGELGKCVILTCGGLFDWLSGAHPRPPQLVITAGLEWLWRLVREPARLWRRYILGNPAFVVRFSKQLLKKKRGRRG